MATYASYASVIGADTMLYCEQVSEPWLQYEMIITEKEKASLPSRQTREVVNPHPSMVLLVHRVHMNATLFIPAKMNSARVFRLDSQSTRFRPLLHDENHIGLRLMMIAPFV